MKIYTKILKIHGENEKGKKRRELSDLFTETEIHTQTKFYKSEQKRKKK